MRMGRCQTLNPTRPVSRLPLIVLQVLVSLKVGLTCYSNSHTLQLASKANKHGIIIPKPCTHLSQHQTTYPRVETSHGRIKQACYEHPNIQGKQANHGRNTSLERSKRHVIASTHWKHSSKQACSYSLSKQDHLQKMHIYVNA